MKKAFVSLLLSAALCSTNIPAFAFSLNETVFEAVSYTHLTLPTNREV